ncbi:MAG: hypothetical protein GY765_30695 [bacterium]|nr:hypothetical protein [bacterium]
MLKKSLALLALLLFALIQAAQTTDTTGARETEPFPKLLRFRASSWYKHFREEVFSHTNYMCNQQVGPHDSMIMEFDNPITPTKLKKHLRLHNEKTGRTIPFTCRQLKPNQIKISCAAPFQKDNVYRFSLPETNLYFYTIPAEFTLLCAKGFLREDIAHVIVLLFSTPIDRGDKDKLKVFYITPMGKKIPQEFTVRRHGNERCLYIYPNLSRKAGGYINKFQVEIGAGLKNIFGQPMGRELKTEAVIYSREILPQVSPRFTRNTLSLDLINIKNIDYSLFTFKPHMRDYLKRWTKSGNVSHDLSPYIAAESTHTYVTNTFGKTQNKTPLPGRAKSSIGLYGVRVTRYQPGTSYYLKRFHDYLCVQKPVPTYYLKRRYRNASFKDGLPLQPVPGSTMVFYNTGLEFLVRSDGKTAFLWLYKGNDAKTAKIGLNMETTPTLRGGVNPTLRGRVTPTLRGRVNPTLRGRVNPTLRGRVTPTPRGGENLYRLQYPAAPGPARWIQHDYFYPYRDKDNSNKQTYYFSAKNPQNGDVNFCGVDARFLKETPPEQPEHTSVFLFTDRDLYEPGAAVYTGGILKVLRKTGDIGGTSAGREVVLNIKGPDNTVCAQTNVKTDKWGGFSHTFTPANQLKKGTYTITAESAGTTVHTAIRIESFAPDRFHLVLEDADSSSRPAMLKEKTNVRLPRYRIDASHLTGTPLIDGEIDYRVEEIPSAKSSRFTTSPISRVYSFSNCEDFKPPFPRLKGSAALDKKGSLILDAPFKKLENIRRPIALQLNVTGVSRQGKEYHATARTLYVPGNRVMGIHVPGDSGKNTPVAVNLAVIDHKGRPASCDAEIWIYEKRYGKPPITLKHFPRQNYNKRRQLNFRPTAAGKYIIKCIAYDQQKHTVTTSRSFPVYETPPRFKLGHLIANTVKSSYRVGETAELVILSSLKTQVMVTFEGEHIFHARTLTVTGPATVPFVIRKSHRPGFKIRVTAMIDQTPMHKEINLLIKNNVPRLNVAIHTAQETAPGAEEKITFQVTTAAGEKAAARLQVYCVDEGSLSFSGYRTPEPAEGLQYCTGRGRNNSTYATFSSADNKRRFYFYPGPLDIQSENFAFAGRVLQPDGSPLAGVKVTLGEADNTKIDSSETSNDGGFGFRPFTRLARWIKFEKPGYVTQIQRGDIWGLHHRYVKTVMFPLEKWESPRVETGYDLLTDFKIPVSLPAPSQRGPLKYKYHIHHPFLPPPVVRPAGNSKNLARVFSLRYPFNKKPLLFFKTIETDTGGRAQFVFTAGQRLSTYRIIAVAYNRAGSGSGEAPLKVSK